MVKFSDVSSQHFEKFLSGHVVSQIPEEEESLDIMDLGKDKLEDMDNGHITYQFLFFGCTYDWWPTLFKNSKFAFSKTIKPLYLDMYLLRFV